MLVEILLQNSDFITFNLLEFEFNSFISAKSKVVLK